MYLCEKVFFIALIGVCQFRGIFSTNTAYWCPLSPVSGFLGHQYSSLVTSFSSFWFFMAPIQLIGDLFLQFLVFPGTNTAYWCPLSPVSGFFGHQYRLLVTSFSSFWFFRAPIQLIGDLFLQFLVFSDTNTAYWQPLSPVSGFLGHQYRSLVYSFSSFWFFRTPILLIGDLFLQFLVF
ncbi:hypothetical protein [Mesobacillus stamsii]|uniref:Uncharacterized protein n=1 Tax=Mesobacillus stamsii TaxID=225347 RepID=A0ABU0FXD8_9BACI|nr:hypothetical protein [Mesobacillus stamsii]MDQ0414587.1 hypothetical protein [Mesobacillus stamsii]